MRKIRQIGIGLSALLFLASCTQSKAAELAQPASKTPSFERAISTAQTIETPQLKFLALLAIARDLSAINDSAEAERLLDEAETYALREKPLWQDFHLAELAEGFAQIGNHAKAKSLISAIRKEDLRQKAQATLAVNFAQKGFLNQAFSQILEIQDSLLRDEAWFKIAALYADKNRNKHALEFESVLQNSVHKAELLSKVATNFAERGRLKDATQLISELKMLQGTNADELTETKVDLLLSVAEESRKLGEPKAAKALLDEAGRLAESAWYSEVRAKTLTKVMTAYFAKNDENNGLYFLTLAWEAARTCPNIHVRIYALSHALYQYDRLGKFDETFWVKYKLLDAFENMARQTDLNLASTGQIYPYDPSTLFKARALILTAQRFAALGNPTFAKMFLSEAPEALQPVGLARIATSYFFAGHKLEAEKAALQAKHEVKWAYFPSLFCRGEAQAEIVEALATVGKQNEAQELAESIVSTYFRAKALSKVARFNHTKRVEQSQLAGK
ncbi:hypothetical protein Ctha_1335 [Chloroherpeton thalassium ATCC 35110]|uniref:Tetratricopeptide domain protein n=1 Tax=Chloroherpeton thalassium (strain ATCC 35110 / GB-78) TaxID=517418 RepID=B3QZA5_CHLT3|nr:hypothetical protein [Chloroherpeton thalassium]ACF13798.1 hypothetical protein Ctha_1335 [Chloroherpeton thalassium ATCC 35110]